MTKREMTFGWGWLAVQMLVLPSLISSIAAPWGSAAVNFCYHLVSLLAVTVIFRRYLKQELRNFTAGFKKVLPVIAVTLAVYYVAGEVLLCLITAIDPGFRNVNDDSVAVLRQGNLALTAGGGLWGTARHGLCGFLWGGAAFAVLCPVSPGGAGAGSCHGEDEQHRDCHVHPRHHQRRVHDWDFINDVITQAAQPPWLPPHP